MPLGGSVVVILRLYEGGGMCTRCSSRDLERVTSILVTHQLDDAFYVANHQAVRVNGRPTIVPADPQKADEAEFLMLRDGRIYFDGTAAQLRASKDPYLQKFLA